jgi:hypothetical protein
MEKQLIKASPRALQAGFGGRSVEEGDSPVYCGVQGKNIDKTLTSSVIGNGLLEGTQKIARRGALAHGG